LLKFSRKLDYAILAVAHLAARGSGSPVSARALAEQSRVPGSVLANILKDLTRAGLIQSVRGVHGGYELAGDPAQLTVGQLVRALEGPVRLVECAVLPGEDAEGPSNCNLESDCPVKAPLRRVHERVSAVLDDMTFAELVAEGSFAPVHRD